MIDAGSSDLSRESDARVVSSVAFTATDPEIDVVLTAGACVEN